MIAKDEQLDIVKEGAYIIIRNAHANVVDEHLRIEVDKWAKIEVDGSKKVNKVNLSNNLSDIEYELVPVQGNKNNWFPYKFKHSKIFQIVINFLRIIPDVFYYFLKLKFQ